MANYQTYLILNFPRWNVAVMWIDCSKHYVSRIHIA